MIHFKTKHRFRAPLPFALAASLFILCLSAHEGNAAARKGKEPVELEKSSVVLGKKSWNEWKAETDWDSYTAQDYKPARDKVSRISRLARGKKAKFLVFAGSWCRDSESGVPAVMKLLGAARIPAGSIELYGVDANLLEPSGAAQRHQVTNSPTVVILKGESELGRIVERPASSWEDEILDILSD